MKHLELRERVVEACKFIEEKGLNWGFSGNISVRLPENGLYLMTPSGLRKSGLRQEDLVVVDELGNVIEGERPPTSEYLMHLTVYKARPDVGAVVHAHPLYVSVLAALRRRLEPLLDEIIVYLGGEVEVAEYALPGSEELARNVVKALGDRCAVILANHGALTCGSDLDEALDALVYLERAAMVSVLCSLMGRPNLLPPEALEIERQLYLLRRGLS
ncbi:MAG: class II aldolase/adducin family protein [Thermofilaceae archaeon]|nr:class II aldolase/adducin family protein [Thermofilaceae archaeon]MCX8180277.1 class II aldolase/adducin family protein [Thermofilaceae archaeon]MDW8004003.1 class II aldolase/adducin family protein [Thermofilaceae archaeon]